MDTVHSWLLMAARTEPCVSILLELPCGSWEWKGRSSDEDLPSSWEPETVGCSTLGMSYWWPALWPTSIARHPRLAGGLAGCFWSGSWWMVGQLRSLAESKTHPILDNAGGPAVAQQTPPLWAKSTRRAPTWTPSMPPGWGSCRSLLSLAALIWVGLMVGSPASASTKWLRCHGSLSSSSCQRTKTIKNGSPGLALLGRWCHFRACLEVFGYLNKSRRWVCHSVSLTDGPDPVL